MLRICAWETRDELVVTTRWLESPEDQRATYGALLVGKERDIVEGRQDLAILLEEQAVLWRESEH